MLVKIKIWVQKYVNCLLFRLVPPFRERPLSKYLDPPLKCDQFHWCHSRCSSIEIPLCATYDILNMIYTICFFKLNNTSSGLLNVISCKKDRIWCVFRKLLFTTFRDSPLAYVRLCINEAWHFKTAYIELFFPERILNILFLQTNIIFITWNQLKLIALVGEGLLLYWNYIFVPAIPNKWSL
jgi:hypothetical protein